ncbi:tetratricopeptide repeat protein [Limnospira platensis]|uniref:tetratricopeptide repeat protein n=1 Tax=Limnospira platensis TaxID=118562 RepID=UPI0002803DF8|nr:hypothetical protein SPLC1_S140080 [Arthrospira platensis C1]UWU51557.1 Tetratricopeptide repeat-containing protein [Arthrospira platensis C1]
MSAGELLRQANQLKRSGKLDEAIALYREAIELNPDFAWTYYELGDALAKQGNLDEAVAYYSEGLKINPNSASASLYYSLGEALAQKGDLDAAVDYLHKAVDINPQIKINIKDYEDYEVGKNPKPNFPKDSNAPSQADHKYLGIVKTQKTLSDRNEYVLYRYLDDRGAFDYNLYVRVQEAGNQRKLNKVWVKKENIQFLSQYIQEELGQVSYGICHGTRRGLEQAWFREFLNADVIGTEISSTASQFPHTIQWDFHKIKPEWQDFFDFIYTNSFDHSYDPEKCLNAWMSCLTKHGVCIIEHSKYHGVDSTSELDPFGAEHNVMPILINRWGKGNYTVKNVLQSPINDGFQTIFFIISKCV